MGRIAEALGISPLDIRRRNLYRLGDETPTGQVLRESVAAEEVLERAAEAAEFEGVRARTVEATAAGGRAPARARVAAPDRPATGRHRGSASPSPGTAPGSPARGEVRLASVASVELEPPTGGSGS